MILLSKYVEDGKSEAQTTFAGLDISVRRNAFGRQCDSFIRDIQVSGFDRPFPAVFIRAPVVEKILSPEVRVLSKIIGPEGNEAIVAVGTDTVIATSFHPELTKDDRFHRLFIDMIRNNKYTCQQ